ncbi:MAG: tetratricopeptide repeat protein [Deltaproteobacteria bacterium]|nr:tetratricopeptide repeat protein [Deltaproteobacteria bacterium]
MISILGGEFGSFGLRYYARRDLLYYNTGRVELGALVIGGDLQGLVYDNKQKLIYIRFRSIPLKGDKLIISPQLSVRLRELNYEPVEVVKTSESFKYAIHAGMLSFHFKKEKVAKKFADMLCAVQKFINEPTEEEIKQDAEFKALASKYRELSIKPEMSEEQRKYIVQANTLTKMKDYEGAIEIYLEAIKIDPVSYPGAYSNLGLLSAQLKLYDEAISYMEKYLMLAPDAEDARGAQDKIYEWEILMKKQ